jgi:uncharacterized protein YqeY
MTLKETIEKDYLDAYKAHKELEIAVLRMVRSAYKNLEINERKIADDADVKKILKKEAKQREDAIVEFEKGGRSDLVERNQAEILVIKAYLPAEMTEDEIRTIVIKVVAETGANSMADMGKVIGLAMKETAGNADGGLVSRVVKEILSK